LINGDNNCTKQIKRIGGDYIYKLQSVGDSPNVSQKSPNIG